MKHADIQHVNTLSHNLFTNESHLSSTAK